MAVDLMLAALALIALAMFAMVHIIAFRRSGTPGYPNPEHSVSHVVPSDDNLTVAGTSLAGLVAGIVAVFFGIDADDALMTFDLRRILELLYVLTYIGLGAFSWIRWISGSLDLHPLIRNLAQSFQGLIIPLGSLPERKLELTNLDVDFAERRRSVPLSFFGAERRGVFHDTRKQAQGSRC